jgi:hypothetical protein
MQPPERITGEDNWGNLRLFESGVKGSSRFWDENSGLPPEQSTTTLLAG